jgi:hypothetical protein
MIDAVKKTHPNWTDQQLEDLELFNQAYPFQIEKTVVTAKSRKLSAEYTFEPPKEIVAENVSESKVKTWARTTGGLFIRK